ncbi:thioredoxin domain-containing protein [Croceicoccus sp. F390]|uniref:Thioredoxin domain-containing protein n=1 Tax=Croceicoccus esteveae TaxID=3075597 RepID=A0ABU2ZDU4_9SPHN|nr:thioredoxin domain-containing protein [Croceicoccus sp. F390]MDT0574767.1 thioredoxin domain-containing protein [Croceicoccus sp. F390]
MPPVIATADTSVSEAARTSFQAGEAAPLPGHLVGREDAPVRLVEYVSYTCSHCAAFEAEAGSVLKQDFAGQGRISVEIRHLVRDPIDLTVAMLANCGPSTRFIMNHSRLLQAQDLWVGKIRATTPDQRARYDTGSAATQRQAIARDAGLYDLMQQWGYDAAALDQCLADEAMARTLAERTINHMADGVTGTPSFAINGELLPSTHGWQALQPQLEARLDD